MKISVHRLTNGNMYINGTSHFGKCEEVGLPDLKAVFSDHKALGMVGKLELASGLDKMEAKIKFNAPYGDVMKLTANPFKSHNMQFRGNLEKFEGQTRVAQVPYKCIMQGAFKNSPAGNAKPQDNIEMESNINVTYCKVEIDGEVIYEVDVLNNIWKVDGVDILAEYRTNLGI